MKTTFLILNYFFLLVFVYCFIAELWGAMDTAAIYFLYILLFGFNVTYAHNNE
jgi:hypothetical protein